MIGWLELVILGFAAARIVRMCVMEYGPMNIFGRMRSVCGADIRPTKPGSLGELWNCPWCMSVWWSLVMFAAWSFWPQYTLPVATVFAISFVAGGAVKFTSR